MHLQGFQYFRKVYVDIYAKLLTDVPVKQRKPTRRRLECRKEINKTETHRSKASIRMTPLTQDQNNSETAFFNPPQCDVDV
jgi:hypothetical protein